MKLPSYSKNNTLATLCAFVNIENETEHRQWAVVALRIGLSKSSMAIRIVFSVPEISWHVASHTWSEIEDATDWCREDLADEIDRLFDEQF
jgi:hypothetical protein